MNVAGTGNFRLLTGAQQQHGPRLHPVLRKGDVAILGVIGGRQQAPLCPATSGALPPGCKRCCRQAGSNRLHPLFQGTRAWCGGQCLARWLCGVARMHLKLGPADCTLMRIISLLRWCPNRNHGDSGCNRVAKRFVQPLRSFSKVS